MNMYVEVSVATKPSTNIFSPLLKKQTTFIQRREGREGLFSGNICTYTWSSGLEKPQLWEYVSVVCVCMRAKVIIVCHLNERIALIRYGLDANSTDGRACFLCDAWSGFFSSGHGEQHRRRSFYELHNVEEPTRPPGGWSSHGQPTDQLHSMFRKRIRSLDMSALGFHGDLRNRGSS